MATATTTRNQGKSAFIKELLFDNPQANVTAVNEAWKAAGMDGKISVSLVNKQRSELGLTGNLRKGRKPASGKNAANTATTKKAMPTTKIAKKAQNDLSRAVRVPVTKTRGANSSEVFADVERDIDRLIFKLMEVGGLTDIEDALRAVRRQLVLRTHTA
jgi:hypothetical protein